MFQLTKVLGNAVLASLLICLPAYAWSTQQAGPYTYAKRYNVSGQLTGEINPRKNANSDNFTAVLYQYYTANESHSGLLKAKQYGALRAWQNETVAPKNWPNFSVSHQELLAYDQYGRKQAQAVASANGTIQAITQFVYDAQSRIKCKVVYMDTGSVDFNNLPSLSSCADYASVSSTEHPNRVTEYQYNEYDKVTKEWHAKGTDVSMLYASYTYDGLQVSTVTDANNNTSQYSYDDNGRLIKWCFPSTNKGTQTPNCSDYERYTYDANDNRISLRKRDGKTINYQYDNLNRLVFKDIPGGTAHDVYYRYNLQGLALYARYQNTNGHGVNTTYNGFGEIKAETTTTASSSYTVQYQHDKNGNVSRLTYPDNRHFSYTHDGLDRLKTLKDPNGSTLDTYGYEQYGRPKTLTAGGSTTTLGYDSVSRINSIKYRFNSDNDNVDVGFEYNPANQITRKDLTNDLFEHKGGSGPSGSYGVNGLNQYTSFGGKSFDYDANANMTSTGDTDFSYDTENRLISASGEHNATLTYDPKGRLQTISPQGGTKTTFVYAGDALIAEYQNGQMTHRYVHGGGTEAPLVTYTGSGIGSASRQYLHTNHQGSVIAATSPGGVVDAINTYDAYGIPGDNNQGRFAYTGQLYLPSLGLYYYKARIYNPELGRFMQTDPVGYEDQMNLYTYVHNDPMNMIDPTGESAVMVWGTRAAGVGVGLLPIPGARVAAVGIIAATIPGDTPSGTMNNESSNPVDDLIGTTTPGEETKGRTRSHEKPGTIGTANDDFDGIVDPDSVKDRGEGVRTGTTTDGRSANVRPKSTDGRPTVEIQDGKNKDKIRYNDPDKQN